jgi:VCBS repeat-containing protein
MRTRTLLLLSVAVGLAILLAGGVFLFQLSNESAAVEVADIGEEVEVGDVVVTVEDVATSDEATLAVNVEIGGVDDADGIDSFRLITGTEPLRPIAAPAAGRCTEITEAPQSCAIEFDVTATEGSNRVLVLRRGDEQRRWDLGGA